MAEPTGLKVYVTSISGSREIKKMVTKIQDTLNGCKIDFEEIDVAADSSKLGEMRAKMNDPRATVPQIFKGDEHLGVSSKK